VKAKYATNFIVRAVQIIENIIKTLMFYKMLYFI